MRFLGIDYGEKNVGLALTDDKGMMAFPHSVIGNDKNLVSMIEKIAQENGATEIVVGESKDFKGKPNKIMKKVDAFVTELRAKGLAVHLEPEFMSSEQARHFTGENAMIDASAATIILQSYIDKKK